MNLTVSKLGWALPCLLSACGAASAAPPQSATTEAESGAPFVVHEWGLIDVFRDGEMEIGAGAGTPDGHAVGDTEYARKPVVYFHLDEGVRALDVRVDVQLAGTLVESWPTLTRHEGNRFGWDASLTACGPGEHSAATDLTVMTSRTECPASDGYCEVADLPSYETADAACVDVGDEQGRLLFYRGLLSPGTRLPLSVEGAASTLRIRTAETLPQRIYLVRDEQAFLLHPSANNATLLEADAEPCDGAASFTRDLLDAGLTEGEANAFMRAWSASLFEGDVQSRERMRLWRGAEIGAEFTLLYFLPRADIERLAPMQVTPTPRRLERVMAVRHHIAI
jgi:hypothetical protein